MTVREASPTNPQSLPGFSKPVSRHGRLTALSMMKDEGPCVLEWVAHHLAVGFTDFVVYTNDCTDGTDTMLRRLQALGIVEHRENVVPAGKKPQPSAFRYAQDEPEVAASDWLMPFDADEFLCINLGDGSLDGLIDAILEQVGNGLVVTWRTFGSGGIRRWSRAPVTEEFLMAAPPMWRKGWGVKTLFQFDPDVWRLGIHRPKMRKSVLETDFPEDVRWLNGSGAPMEDYFKFRGWRSIARTVGYDWAQLNHYAVKSVEGYALRRFRGNVNNKSDKYNTDYWALQDRNEVRDEAVLRYAPERRRIMDILLSDPELSALHEAACAAAEAQLETFRASEEYKPFVEALETAGQIPINRVVAKPPKRRDPEKVARQMSEIERRTVEAASRTAADRAGAMKDIPQDLIRPDPGKFDPSDQMEWIANHGLFLPVSPAYLTADGLEQAGKGKFQRNLARRLPAVLGEDGALLEIGSASGFVGLHLAQTNQGLVVTLNETDANLRDVRTAVMERNDIPLDERIRCDDRSAFSEVIEASGATSLILSDPALDLAQVRGLVDDQLECVIITGRLLVKIGPEAEEWISALRALGLDQPIPLDFAQGIALGRGPA